MDTESARALYCRALFLIKHTLNTLHDRHIIIISSTNQHITYLSSFILLFHTLCTYCVQLWLFTGPLCLWNTHTHIHSWARLLRYLFRQPGIYDVAGVVIHHYQQGRWNLKLPESCALVYVPNRRHYISCFIYFFYTQHDTSFVVAFSRIYVWRRALLPTVVVALLLLLLLLLVLAVSWHFRDFHHMCTYIYVGGIWRVWDHGRRHSVLSVTPHCTDNGRLLDATGIDDVVCWSIKKFVWCTFDWWHSLHCFLAHSRSQLYHIHLWFGECHCECSCVVSGLE